MPGIQPALKHCLPLPVVVIEARHVHALTADQKEEQEKALEQQQLSAPTLSHNFTSHRLSCL